MALIIKEVKTNKELNDFIDFPNKLYKDNPYFVPKLSFDEKQSLSPKHNPAYDFCTASLFLAYQDGKIVGRVAAIINSSANKKWNHKEVRFGWIDFIDDRNVSKALIDKVIDYGRERGMEKIVGPLGFTDFDPEGMLVEGFDKLCTMVLIYNHPYYPEHLEAMGFTKEIDWLEFKIEMPKEGAYERMHRLSNIVKERYNLRLRKISRKDIKREDLGHKIFDLINESYSELYNFTILPQKLIDKYVNFYLGFLDLKYVALVENEKSELIGVGICMPSIAKALQKTRGKLFPFGWFHLLKSLYIKREECLELLLVGVKPSYANKGVLAVIFDDLVPIAIKDGFKYAETNAELENNYKMQNPWQNFDHSFTKRRRIYAKDL